MSRGYRPGRQHNRFPNGPAEREGNRYWVECRTLGKPEADRRKAQRKAELEAKDPPMKILIKIDSETAARLLAEATPNITEQARDGLRDDGRRALIRAAIERRLQA